MQHSGASGRQGILGPARAAGSARCALGVAWRGERLVGTTQRRGIDSRRELLDAQGGCGLKGRVFSGPGVSHPGVSEFSPPARSRACLFMSSYTPFFFFRG